MAVGSESCRPRTTRGRVNRTRARRIQCSTTGILGQYGQQQRHVAVTPSTRPISPNSVEVDSYPPRPELDIDLNQELSESRYSDSGSKPVG